MKREHEISKKLPSGCVFFAPLTKGDMSDHVSGSIMEVDPNHSATYDENENAWLFEDLSQSTYTQVASFTGLNMPFDISNIGFTILYDIKIIKFGNGGQMVGCLPVILGGNTVGHNSAHIADNLNTWYCGGIVFPKYEGSPRSSKLYSNGEVSLITDRGTTKFTGNELTNKRIDIQMRRSSSHNVYFGAKFYLKNVYVFNNALTTEEIRKIQGLE